MLLAENWYVVFFFFFSQSSFGHCLFGRSFSAYWCFDILVTILFPHYAFADRTCYPLLAYEEAEEKERQAREGVPFSAVTLRNASTRDLEKALRWIRDEIRMREED